MTCIQWTCSGQIVHDSPPYNMHISGFNSLAEHFLSPTETYHTYNTKNNATQLSKYSSCQPQDSKFNKQLSTQTTRHQPTRWESAANADATLASVARRPTAPPAQQCKPTLIQDSPSQVVLVGTRTNGLLLHGTGYYGTELWQWNPQAWKWRKEAIRC